MVDEDGPSDTALLHQYEQKVTAAWGIVGYRGCSPRHGGVLQAGPGALWNTRGAGLQHGGILGVSSARAVSLDTGGSGALWDGGVQTTVGYGRA